MRFLSKISKKRRISIAFMLLLLCLASFLILRNFFHADTGGGATISGTIYGEDTKAPLSGVSLRVSSLSPGSKASAITTQTDSSGRFTITQPDSSFKSLYITQNNYWDISGVIVNPLNRTSIDLNLALKSGFGTQEAEFVAFKKPAQTEPSNVFGLSLQPFNNNPSSLTSIVPNGSTYSEAPANVVLTTTDYASNTTLTSDNSRLNFSAHDAGHLPVNLTGTSAVYSPDTDKYYIIGGTLADGTLSSAIYEYDRNNPEGVQKVADLPYGITGASAIYIPKIASIYILGGTITDGTNAMGTGIFGIKFQPQFGYLLSGKIEISNKYVNLGSKITPLLVGDSLYLFSQSSDGTTSLYTTNNVGGTCVKSKLAFKPVNCPIEMGRVSTKISVSDFTSYYSSISNKVYILGGISNGDANNPLDSIYQIDPTSLSADPALLPQKLAYPTSGAILQTIVGQPDKFNLVGGNHTMTILGGQHNSGGFNHITTFNDVQAGLSIDKSQDYNFPYPVTNVATAQDNSNHIFIFPNQTSQAIQEYTNGLLLKAGTVYGSSANVSNTTVVIYGRSQDNSSLTVPDGFDTSQGMMFLTIPKLSPAAVNNISVKDGDVSYTFKEAIDHKLINPFGLGHWHSSTNITTGEEIIMPGDYLVFNPKKAGLVIGMVSSETSSNQNTKYVELPSSVSYDDINNIVNNYDSMSSIEQGWLDTKEAQVLTAVTNQTTQTSFDGDVPTIYFTKNGKMVFPNKLNPYYLDQLSGLSINASPNIGVTKAKADASTPDYKLTVNQSSFGTDTVLYNRVNTFIQNATISNVEAILGHPIYYTKMEIVNNNLDWWLSEAKKAHQNDPTPTTPEKIKEQQELIKKEAQDNYDNYKDNGCYDPSLNKIIIDFSSTLVLPYIEETLLHETSHSWRGPISAAYSNAFEEGMAEGFAMSFSDIYNLNYTSIHKRIVNFDYWSDVLKFFNTDNETGLADINSLDDYYNDTLPNDGDFYTRVTNGAAVEKFVLETYKPSSPTFFQYFQTNLLNGIISKLKQEGVAVNSGNIQEVFQNLMSKAKNGEQVPDISYDGVEIVNDILSKSGPGGELKVEDQPVLDWLDGKSTLNYDAQNDPYPDDSRDNALLQYPNSQSLCLPTQTPCKYTNESAIFFSSASQPTPNKWEIHPQEYYSDGSLTTHSVNIYTNFSTMPKYSNGYLSQDSVVNINPLLLSITPTNYSGSLLLTTNQQSKLDVGDGFAKSAFAWSMFMKDGSGYGSGLYGVADVSDGSTVTLEKINPDGSTQVVGTTSVTNGIYEIPNTKDLFGCFIVSATGGGTIYLNKPKGNYEQDFKSTTEPAISDISTKDKTISFKVNKPVATFAEIREKGDDFAWYDYGQTATGSPSAEGYEIKGGTRTITSQNLTDGKTYTAIIGVIDRSGNVVYSDPVDFTVDSIKNITVTSNITTGSTNATTISWDTNSALKGVINYGTNTSYGSTSGETQSAATHQSITLSGLTPEIDYNFQIVAYANTPSDPDVEKSSNQVFTTFDQIKNIQAIPINNSSATVTWSTTHPLKGVVNLGGTSGTEQSAGTTHSVTLTGLTINKTYHYQILAYANTTGDSSISKSDDQTFIISSSFAITNSSGVYKTGTNYPWSLAIDYKTTQPGYCQVNGGAFQGPATSFTSALDPGGKVCKLKYSYTINCYQKDTSPRVYSIPLVQSWGPIKPNYNAPQTMQDTHTGQGWGDDTVFTSEPSGIITNFKTETTHFAEKTISFHVNGNFSGQIGYYPKNIHACSSYNNGWDTNELPCSSITNSDLNAPVKYVNFSGSDPVIVLKDLNPGLDYYFFIEPTETDFPDSNGQPQCYDIGATIDTSSYISYSMPEIGAELSWVNQTLSDGTSQRVYGLFVSTGYGQSGVLPEVMPEFANVQLVWAKSLSSPNFSPDVITISSLVKYTEHIDKYCNAATGWCYPAYDATGYYVPLDENTFQYGWGTGLVQPLGWEITLKDGATYFLNAWYTAGETPYVYDLPTATRHSLVSSVSPSTISQTDSTASITYIASPLDTSAITSTPTTTPPDSTDSTKNSTTNKTATIPKSVIQYSTDKTNLNNTYVPPNASQSKLVQTVELPNLKSRTYYYRIVTTDQKGNKYYSEIYTLKHGNKYIRFANDLFNNSWDWIKSKVKI